MAIYKNRQLLKRSVILAVVTALLLHTVNAQIETIFTQNTTFNIPTQEGKISFSVNGTYTSAILANGTWSFTNLLLNGSQNLDTFQVSARNSNITIDSFILRNTTLRSARLRYVAESSGEQTFKMGIAAGEGRWGLHPEWGVIVNGIWLGEGDGWKIAPDGTVTINGATGNVSVLHYNFLGLGEADKNMSFYEQHSVLILTLAFMSFMVSLGTIFWLKNKRLSSKQDVTSNQEYIAKKVSSG